jgi:hypothetical protein
MRLIALPIGFEMTLPGWPGIRPVVIASNLQARSVAIFLPGGYFSGSLAESKKAVALSFLSDSTSRPDTLTL